MSHENGRPSSGTRNASGGAMTPVQPISAAWSQYWPRPTRARAAAGPRPARASARTPGPSRPTRAATDRADGTPRPTAPNDTSSQKSVAEEVPSCRRDAFRAGADRAVREPLDDDEVAGLRARRRRPRRRSSRSRRRSRGGRRTRASSSGRTRRRAVVARGEHRRQVLRPRDDLSGRGRVERRAHDVGPDVVVPEPAAAGTAARRARTSRTTRPGSPEGRRRAQRPPSCARQAAEEERLAGLDAHFLDEDREAAALELASRRGRGRPSRRRPRGSGRRGRSRRRGTARGSRASRGRCPGRSDRDRGRHLADLRLEQDAVALADLSRAGGGPARVDELVARRDDADPRRRERRHRVDARSTRAARARARRAASRPGATTSPARDVLALAGRRSARAAPRGSSIDGRLRRDLRVLDHHDGVGARGQRGAGHDLEGLPRRRRARGASRPAGIAPSTRERRRDPRDVFRAHRPAVHRRLLERRESTSARASRASTRPNASASGTSSIRRPAAASATMMRRASSFADHASSSDDRSRRVDHVHERGDAEDGAADPRRARSPAGAGTPCARCRSRHRRRRPAWYSSGAGPFVAPSSESGSGHHVVKRGSTPRLMKKSSPSPVDAQRFLDGVEPVRPRQLDPGDEVRDHLPRPEDRDRVDDAADPLVAADVARLARADLLEARASQIS